MIGSRLKRIFSFCICLILCSISTHSYSQSIIRDAEIENTLREFSIPFFDAAGIGPNDVNLILVNDSRLNAFVAGGMNIFLYTGLILEAENPGELIGVIAHETGHIAGAHLIRTRAAIEQASFQTLLTSIIGVAAALGTGSGEAAGAVLAGSSSFAQQGFLAHSRTQEAAADQAAVKYLSDAGYNAEGLLTFLEKLQSQEILPTSQQSEYIRTHPLTSNRIAYLRENVHSTKHKHDFSSVWHDKFNRIQSKLLGFIYPDRALYYKSESIPHRYGRAIAHYRKNNLDKATTMIDALINDEPQNPYFHELKGQMLYENGRIKESLPSYAKAVQLLPGSGLLRIGYGQALLAIAKKDADYQRSILHLERALGQETRSPRIHRLLATAYGRIGQEGIARLHLAEESVLRRDISSARRQIGLAEPALDKSSPKWIRLQDLKQYLSTISRKR